MTVASLSDLMLAAEQADSDYRVAVVGAANARADYEEQYHKALAIADGTSQAQREKSAEKMAFQWKRPQLLAEAQEKAARTHVQVLLGLLVAQQSINKFAGVQDGGGMNADYGNDEW